MKAIKLASVFAVSAVAAAVSTTTLAAEPVFSGVAGLSYSMPGTGNSTFDKAGKGELDLKIDTGVVVIALDFDEAPADNGTDDFTIIDAAYVKQGAVSFGDFDGSVSDDAWNVGDDIVDVDHTGSTQAGVRYAVMPNLTVALEAKAVAGKDDAIGVAANYSQDLGAAKVGVSFGSVDKTTAYAVSASATFGAATVKASYGAQDDDGVKQNAMGVGVDFAASDMLTLSAVYGSEDDKDPKQGKKSGTFLKASYAMGDVTYFVSNKSKEVGDVTEIGATASF
jgi:hypothetical protein